MVKKTIFNTIKNWLAPNPQSKDEVMQILHHAVQDHVLDTNIVAMMEHVLEVEETRVKDVMVPKLQMICIEASWDYHQITHAVTESGHSRLPVLGANRDEIIGILLTKDLLGFAINHPTAENFNLQTLIRPVAFIPETKRLHALLQEFRRSRSHLAIVVDEYGRITGLITIEDVLEEIVGEIEDEHDTDDNINIKAQSENKYLVRAVTPIEEFNKFFSSELDADGVETIAGLIMRNIGHLPKRSEVIVIDQFKFVVLRSDSRRVYLLSVSRESE